MFKDSGSSLPARARMNSPGSSLKIKGAFSLFKRFAFKGVRINYRGSDIGVPQ